MALSPLPLGYCANVHPGDSFAEVRAGLARFAAPLQQRLDRPLAVGLWMTHNAIAELAAQPALADEFAAWLCEQNLRCYTMNAFPFGNFHARRVKEQVYLPDWTSEARRRYTCQVADLLARLLPAGVDGSISTAPLAFKALHPPGASLAVYFPQLVQTAAYLWALHQRTGRTIRLAIEPEPCCVLETTAETIEFFHQLWQHVAGTPAEAAVRTHLGVCYDVCHQAVEFEDVTDSILALDAAGVPLVKIHVTSALELAEPGDPAARAALADYVEERYLHQTFARSADGPLLSVPDLTRALALAPSDDWRAARPWRIHFHVPVDRAQLGPLCTTRPILVAALRAVDRLPAAPHLEVETYTWGVLPGRPAASANVELVTGLEAELRSAQEILTSIRDSSAAGEQHGSQ